MKGKKLGYGLLFALGIALAACGGPTDSSSVEPTPGTSSVPSSSEEAGVITNEDLGVGQTTYTDASGNTQDLNIDHLYRNAGYPHVKSYTVGGTKSRLLVAPIRFVKNSSDPNDTITADDALYERIRITFSGTDEETEAVGGYRSLQRFYEESSFNKGGFEVIMLPCWVDYTGTAQQFASASSGSAGLYSSAYVREWYIAEYNKTDHGLLGADWQYSLRDLDSDGDGYIDLVWNVYAYPYTSGTDWWAYVTYSNNQPNYTQPQVMTIAWASTNFMSGYNGYDSHTFIHETGHTLGLNDYYDYNNTWKPMARVDYMDQNMGDHNAYSKFALGWINPWVLREEDIDGVADESGVGEGITTAEVTLRASSVTGDALVLASPGYNNTAFDEYLILELVGPYGISETDYVNGYDGTTGFREAGIRVLHVDARANGSNWNTYYTDADSLGQNGYGVRVCNTYGGRMGLGRDADGWPEEGATTMSTTDRWFTEVSIVEATIQSSNWMTSPGYNATTASLFTQNKRMTMNDNSVWCKTFFPSETNLWNKAKTITGGTSNRQQFEIDETVTANYSFRVTSIEEDETYGAVAKVRITLSD